jgi:glycosyltransferase involved in cell wall biosynthesis
MKKIAVNTRLLRKNAMDGIGWVTYNVLKEITINHPQVEFHFLFDSGIDDEFLFSKNIIPHNLFPPAKHAVLNVAWFEWSAKNLLNKLSADLFLSPDGILCLDWNGMQYGIVHDVNYEHRPEDLKFVNRIYYKYFIPRSIVKACRIATVSEYSKKDIISAYKTPAEKIDVIYPGINDFFHPLTSENLKQQVKNRFTQGFDYFIFIGTISPRKNISRLMQAFNLFKQQTNSNLKLVLAGREMYRTAELHELKTQLQYGDDVIFTGRLNNDDLSDLLAAAFCMAFVPLIEGFGLPPVEAMQCNVPVIASNVTSVPEIVGDAGLLVNPYSIEEIKNAMYQIYTDNGLRQLLLQKGSIRKQQFNWKFTAQNLWDSINKCFK